jgi:hypothetical protein
MNRSHHSLLPAAILSDIILCASIDRAPAQEIALTPIEVNEVARGYRADALKLIPVVNDKNETLGRIDDFISARTAISTLSLPSAIIPD